MKEAKLFLTYVLFMGAISSFAQYDDDKYTVNISGASRIVLDYWCNPGENDSHSFDFDNNLGVYYPDDDGVIRIPLSKGQYQYMALRNGREPQNGSFYITNRHVYFEVRMYPPFCGIDTRRLVTDAYREYYYNEKKKARDMFYTAAEAGNVDAMYEYSRMCRNGIGGKKNKNHAYHFMNEALKHGHPMAAYMLENFNDKRLWRGYK